MGGESLLRNASALALASGIPVFFYPPSYYYNSSLFSFRFFFFFFLPHPTRGVPKYGGWWMKRARTGPAALWDHQSLRDSRTRNKPDDERAVTALLKIACVSVAIFQTVTIRAPQVTLL